MRLEEAINRYAPDIPAEGLRELVRRDLLDLPVRWNPRLRTTLGQYKSRRNRLTGEEFPVAIELNVRLRRESPERLTNTFLHEVAHLLAGHAAAHGWKFQAKARMLGASGARSVASSELVTIAHRSPIKVVAACSRCGYEVKRRRRLARSKVYNHRGCGGVMVPR
jgi:predicted SprT family Zn-dependent metalloprotease